MHNAKACSRNDEDVDRGLVITDKSDVLARVNAGDLPFHVPSSLLPEVVSVTDSKATYAPILAQRDRHLRLLIRRYVNQIQYGCRNVNCTTPTCLSYRKRNSKGPLRRYTDLSARTLACRLVEDYGQDGREAGLCRNEPVVPWYEDPTVAKKRWSSLEKTEQKILHGQENGDPTKTDGLRSRRHSKSSIKTVIPAGYPPHRGPNHDQEHHSEQESPVPSPAAQNIPGHAPNKAGARFHTRPDHGREREDRTVKDGHVTLQDEGDTAPQRRRDVSSFTQCLFDLMPLRALSRPPPTKLNPTEPVSPNVEEEGPIEEDARSPPGREEEKQAAESPEQHQGPPQSADPAGSEYALQFLSWKSLVWLDKARVEEAAESRVALRQFIRRSIRYCLSSPARLLASARDWQGDKKETSHEPTQEQRDEGSESSPDSFRPDPEAESDDRLTQEASRHNPSGEVMIKYDTYATLVAFSVITMIWPYEEMLDSIFEAVQHLYALPPWLPNRLAHINNSGSPTHVDRAASPALTSVNPSHRSRLSGHFLAEEHLWPRNWSAGGGDETALTDHQASELCLVALLAITSVVYFRKPFSKDPQSFAEFIRVRNTATAYPSGEGAEYWEHLVMTEDWIFAIDKCEDWYVLRLLSSVMGGISHHLALFKYRRRFGSTVATKLPRRDVVQLMIDHMDPKEQSGLWKRDGQSTSFAATVMIDLARTIILKMWDRRPNVRRSGAVGGALELLAGFYRRKNDLNLDPTVFVMPFIADAFDDIKTPAEWLSFRADGQQMHMLSFSFLFEPATLVKYFRAINIEAMRTSHESASIVYNNARQYLSSGPIPVYGAKEVLAQMRPHMAKYFVLTIRRDNVLEDAINQIWRRQRRELMRPLRVRLGKDEGEDGLDHGGVQQEFFRVVFAQALRPDYGMFVIDDTTRMTWFQPGSLEPLYKFEALGILMSLAVYNGVTLPTTFPVAFYRKLLGLKVKKLEHVQDGWPGLAKGLEILLDWSEGDVGDVMARTYEFSYDLFGTIVTVDMQKVGENDPWPPRERATRKGKEKAKSTSFELPMGPEFTPPGPGPTIVPGLNRSPSIEIKGISTPLSIDSDMLEDAPLVTNANRGQYVKDYIMWLTDKSVRPQYEAFAKGFYTCLDRTALSIFTPEALKQVIEGHQQIDIDELEKTASYDEYDKSSATIMDFWQVVRSFSPSQHRQLLEFVTASDRVPVNGLSSIQFIVQKNGEDDLRLPSSSTCYGRLLLPQYSSRKIMEEKLAQAIENSIGFGSL